ESSTLHFEAARNSDNVDASAVDAAYGQGLLAAGDPERAADVFERSLVGAPADRRAQRNLARAVSYVAAGAPETGAAVLEDILAPDNPDPAEPATAAEARYVMALAWAEAGDRRRASETFRSLPALYPKSAYAAPAELWVGRLALEDGDVETAVASFAGLAGGTDPLADKAKYWLGWSYFVSRQYDEAGRTLEDFAAHTSDEVLASFGRYWAAEAATRTGNNAENRKKLEEFVGRYPDHPLADNALFRLGKLLLATGRQNAARETLASLAELYADRELADDALYLYALSLLEQKEDAGAAFWNLVTKFPASPYAPEGLFDLAQARFAAHDFAGAVKTLSALLSRYPGANVADDAIFMMGECYLHQGQYERAKETYAGLVEKYPASRRADEARYEIELCNFKQGKYQSQIELAKSYIAMYPQSRLNGELLILLGEYYYHEGDYDQAEKYLAAVAEVKADEKTVLDALNLLAEVYLSRGYTAKAIAQYGAVAAAAKDDDVALAALFKAADIYERAGDRSAAIEAYGAIVDRFGEKRETAKAQFKIGENLRAARLYKESNTALEKLARKWPVSEYATQAELYRGLNLLELGAADEAVEHLAAAAATGSRAVAVQGYYFLGVAERDRGNNAESREYFTKVLTNYRDFPDWVRQAQGELKRK
ncbi:MAG TPA: tetratricopeptide repeat protein, partial [bacterium]|nr:tetratricopeptide repeat protein [bacterium]